MIFQNNLLITNGGQFIIWDIFNKNVNYQIEKNNWVEDMDFLNADYAILVDKNEGKIKSFCLKNFKEASIIYTYGEKNGGDKNQVIFLNCLGNNMFVFGFFFEGIVKILVF